LEFYENNFTAKYSKAHMLSDPNMGDLVQWEHPKFRVEYKWDQEHTKHAIALKRCKIGLIGSHICAFD